MIASGLRGGREAVSANGDILPVASLACTSEQPRSSTSRALQPAAAGVVLAQATSNIEGPAVAAARYLLFEDRAALVGQGRARRRA